MRQIGGVSRSLHRQVPHFAEKLLILSMRRLCHESVCVYPTIAPVQQAHMGPLTKPG